jgi:hypothetical protein
MPPSIYIDHSVVSCEAWWPKLDEAIQTRGLQLVVSLWNLYEIGNADDHKQQERRVAFLETLKPQWIFERRAAQKREVERFLWQRRLGIAPRELLSITPYLSLAESHFPGSKGIVGLTPLQFIRGIDYTWLRSYRQYSPQALTTMQNADPKLRRQQEKDTFFECIEQSIPVHDPDERAFTASQRKEFLQFCYDNEVQFFAECRSLGVEHALVTVRTSDPGRKPTESDGPDLQHSAMALPYCDIFFTRDGFQTKCAKFAKNRLPAMGLAALCTTPEQLALYRDGS